jgi:hypothetical protein
MICALHLIMNSKKLTRKLRWKMVLDKHLIECRGCNTWFHIGEHSMIYYYKRTSLDRCPACYPGLHRKKYFEDFNIRKVRCDKKPLQHKRKVTAERVKRWRSNRVK